MTQSVIIPPLEVPQRRVIDILITAVEQGCGHWCNLTGWPSLPRGMDLFDKFALNNAGWMEFTVKDDGGRLTDEKHTLGWVAIQKGLKVMAEKYGRHFGDFMVDNHDAETADVFLQCCLLGEVRYG